MNTLCLLGTSDSRFKRAFCVSCFWFRRSTRGWTAFRMGVSHSWKERFFPLQRCAAIFASHRRTSTGYHACVLNLSNTELKAKAKGIPTLSVASSTSSHPSLPERGARSALGIGREATTKFEMSRCSPWTLRMSMAAVDTSQHPRLVGARGGMRQSLRKRVPRLAACNGSFWFSSAFRVSNTTLAYVRN